MRLRLLRYSCGVYTAELDNHIKSVQL